MVRLHLFDYGIYYIYVQEKQNFSYSRVLSCVDFATMLTIHFDFFSQSHLKTSHSRETAIFL